MNDCVASCWEQRAWRSEQRAETADVLRACTAFDDGGAVSRENWKKNAAAMRCSVVRRSVRDLTELV